LQPIKQGHDYDPRGEYVAHWIPALQHLSSEHRQSPWAAPEAMRRKAGLLGGDGSEAGDEPYPIKPIVEQRNWRSHYGRSQRGQGGDGGPPRGKPKGRGPGGGRGRGQ
jgi:deoxyribodipyrimidine photo-lyase